MDIFGIAYILCEGCYSSSICTYIHNTKLIITQFFHSHIQIQSKPFFLKSTYFNIIINIVKLLFNMNCFWNRRSPNVLFFCYSIILSYASSCTRNFVWNSKKAPFCSSSWLCILLGFPFLNYSSSSSFFFLLSRIDC